MLHLHSTRARLLLVFGFLSFVSVGFFLVDAAAIHSYAYWYLVWNLFLAWLPLLFAVGLVNFLKKHSWSSTRGTALSLLWLIFLPNSFYIVSDFIHLGDIGQPDVLSNAVLFFIFAVSGLLLGFASLSIVHEQLLTRFRRQTAHALVTIILLICSYAVYLGRDLRWNSWDAVLHPAGVLFGISEPFINPGTHHDAFTTTAMFFVLLGTLYVVGWQLSLLWGIANQRAIEAAE